MLVGEVGQLAKLVWLVNRSHLGRLGDRDRSRLYMVFNPDSVIRSAHTFNRQFSILRGNRNQLAACELFWSATFIHVDVRGLTADDGVIRVGEGLEAEAIGCSAVEDKRHFNIRSKMPLELTNR